MESNINNKKDELVYYQKINIFGEPGVGKSTLISYMEKYNSKDLIIEDDNLENEEESFIASSSLVEEVKRIQIELNENRNLYLNIYETNINRYDTIKMNLDTLLNQTECVIIMWENNYPETFENIPGFVLTLENCIKQKKIENIPIIIIQNKMDLDLEISRISVAKDEFNDSLKNFKMQHPNILYKEISLKNKNDFYYLIGDIDNQLYEKEKTKNNLDEDNIHNIRFEPILRDISLKDKNINIKHTINCLLLGNSSVGKTTFLNCLIGKQNQISLSTIGISQSTFLAEVNKNLFYFRITDTAGQERFNSIPGVLYKHVTGILLFFDVTNEETFDKISFWIDEIKNKKGNINKEYELFLIANKIDLSDDRKVLKKSAKELAEKYNIKYYECSSKKGINIYEIFSEIALKSYNIFENSNFEENLQRRNSVVLNENKHKNNKEKKNEIVNQKNINNKKKKKNKNDKEKDNCC